MAAWVEQLTSSVSGLWVIGGQSLRVVNRFHLTHPQVRAALVDKLMTKPDMAATINISRGHP